MLGTVHVAKADYAMLWCSGEKFQIPGFGAKRRLPSLDMGDRNVLAVTDEALSTAAFCDHPYKRVAVSAWPVRALSERGKLHEASRTLMRSLAEAGHIQHPVSKMDAQELLWHAAWLPPIDGGEQALSELVKACETAESWKSGRCLRNII